MYPNRELWFSRNLILIWLPVTPWHNPSLHTCKPSGLPQVLSVEPFIDLTCVKYATVGLDWFWRCEPTSAARLIRARDRHYESASAMFPQFGSALTVILEWLDLAFTRGIQEASRIAALGPVSLPNSDFILDACGLVESGLLPKWIGWESDAAKRAGSLTNTGTVVTAPPPQPEPRQRKAKSVKSAGQTLFA